MLINLVNDITDPYAKDHIILSQLFNSQYHNLKAYDYRHTIMRDADITFHCEFVNPVALGKSAMNILVVSTTSHSEELLPYLSKIDIVFCKTNTAVDFFRQNHKRVKYLSWTGWDRLNNAEFTPNIIPIYYTYLTNTNFEMVNKIARNWHSQNALHIFTKLIGKDAKESVFEFIGMDGVEIIEDAIPDVKKYTVYVSPTTEDFDIINIEEASSGSIIVCPHSELFNHHKSQFNYGDNVETLTTIISQIDAMEPDDFKKRSELARTVFRDNQYEFMSNFTRIMTKVLTDFKKPEAAEPEEKPLVSIITLTYNRPKMIKLAEYCYKRFNYPVLEWIIVNDSDEDVEYPQLPDARVVRLDKRHTISEKRNLGCEVAKGDFIFMMDDDDYYSPDAIENLLTSIQQNNADCAFCSSIACYDIRRKASIINTPSIFDPPQKRVSEATLFFKRSFWEEKRFSPADNGGAEGEDFIGGRYHQCVEVDWRGVIISIIHGDNISTRKIPFAEPNGNHFVNDEWGFTQEALDILERV